MFLAVQAPKLPRDKTWSATGRALHPRHTTHPRALSHEHHQRRGRPACWDPHCCRSAPRLSTLSSLSHPPLQPARLCVFCWEGLHTQHHGGRNLGTPEARATSGSSWCHQAGVLLLYLTASLPILWCTGRAEQHTRGTLNVELRREASWPGVPRHRPAGH
jgi:hypothetical protein